MALVQWCCGAFYFLLFRPILNLSNLILTLLTLRLMVIIRFMSPLLCKYTFTNSSRLGSVILVNRDGKMKFGLRNSTTYRVKLREISVQVIISPRFPL